MNDDAYRKRLTADLDKWIAGGLVGAEQRTPILATLPPANERPAASILAWAGSVLAGLAVIAFMAANWDFIPRFMRLVVILGVFWGALYGALWCEKNNKPKSRQASLLFAVLVFASGLGLVGQMYNLAGDPSDVLLAAGLAGLLLGAAGRSGPAAATGLLFSGAWYASNAFDNHAAIGMEDLIAALILGGGAWLARFLRSKVTLHIVIIGVYAFSASLLGKAMISWRLDSNAELRIAALIFAAFWAGWAIYGRSRMLRELPGGSTIYGYGAWFALTAYPFSGFDFSSDLIDPGRILHRLVWLAISLAAMAYGNKDNQRGVLSAGIVSLVIAVGVVMADLQLNLLVAAAIFGLIAAGAFFAAGKMSRNKNVSQQKGRVMSWLDDIRKSILAAGAFLSLMLAGAVYVNANAVASGQEVIVRAQGFDPRSFLSGHYVMLSYDFSSTASGSPECVIREGAPIWAGFAPQPGKMDVTAPSYACSRNELPKGYLALKGKATGYGRIDFGIERFYAPQKDAERIEKALQRFNPEAPPDKQPPVYAVMSIGKDGQARLKALLLGDERIELSWL